LRRWYWYLWALILAGCWILRPLLAAVLSAALIPVRRLYRSHLPRRAAALARARDRHVVGQTVSASKSLLSSMPVDSATDHIGIGRGPEIFESVRRFVVGVRIRLNENPAVIQERQQHWLVYDSDGCTHRDHAEESGGV